MPLTLFDDPNDAPKGKEEEQPNLPESTIDYNQAFAKVMEGLNEEQRAAVEKLDGPVLVLAGPGTGKTQTLAARIGYLLTAPEVQASPYNILCLTFTESGAVAMRKRLLEFIGPDAHRIRIHTFHSFCNDIIQTWPRQFGTEELSLVSELEQISLVKELIDKLPKDSTLKKWKGNIYADAKPLLNLFSIMKSEDWPADYIESSARKYMDSLPDREEFVYKRKYKDKEAGDLKEKEVAKEQKKMDRLVEAAHLFPAYRSLMKDRNRYDYNDMILWVLEAFQEDEEFLLRIQEQLNYILVDEYQDTNGSQNELLHLLISYWDNPDVFVVGDDDQSIYRFQGANVQNIESFFAKYKATAGEPVVLRRNYRSTQPILDASKTLIDRNTERLTRILSLDKDLVASHPELKDLQVTPHVIAYANPLHEEAAIVQQIQQLAEAGEPLNEVAVIYRKHAQASNMVHVLEQKGIAYNLVKQVNILSVPVIKNLLLLLDYLNKEAVNPLKQEAIFFELMYFEVFGIPATDIAAISIHNAKKKYAEQSLRKILANRLELETLGLEDPEAASQFFEKTSKWIKDLKNHTLQEFVQLVMDESGMLSQVLNAPDRVWQLESVNAFFSFIKEEHHKDPTLTIDSLLEIIGIMQENDIPIPATRIMRDEEGINLMTAHGSKGLEFKHVFLIGCTRGAWEGARKGGWNQFTYPDTLTASNEGDDTEESRRLFYVAMTRAKQNLQVSYPSEINGREQVRSLFIDEFMEHSTIENEAPPLTADQVADFLGALYTQDKPITAHPPESDYIDQALERLRINPTGLNQYLKCPVEFYYEKILRVPFAKNEHAAFGTAVHDALHDYFSEVQVKENKFPDEDVLLEAFFKHITKERDGFTDAKFKLIKEYGEQVLKDYRNHYLATWNPIVALEYNMVNIEVDGVPLNGRLDKIEFNGKEAIVVDYKTGKAENGLKKLAGPTSRDPKGKDYWRQMVFYQILMDEDRRKDWKMVGAEMDFIEPDEDQGYVKRQLQISGEDIALVKQQIKDTYEKVMRKEFGPGCGKDDCKWCQFEIERRTERERKN
jgi:DNA helicase-2/ATP-dependent DNA helicase PcrA